MKDRASIFLPLAEEDAEFGVLECEVWKHAVNYFVILSYVKVPILLSSH